MIFVIAPISAPAGQTVCVTVGGVAGTLTVSAWVNDERVGTSVVQEPVGTWRVCVSIPKGVTGAVVLRLADKAGTVHRAIAVSPP